MRWILAPLSWIYWLVLVVRHWLYDEHILPSVTMRIPTICVGNLALGGTGKTPQVEYLVQLLMKRYKVAVLSRGYGRKTRGFLLVDDQSTAETIGDEPMLIHQRYPEVLMAVCEDRVRGIRRLEKMCPDLDVVILDDAFQHRHIRSGLSILLTEYSNLYVLDSLLPVGSLRDLKSRATKADIVVVTKCPEPMAPIDRRVVSNHLKLAAFQQLIFSHIEYAPLAVSGKVLVVTAIANPQPLVEHVKTQASTVEHIRYIDHHRFTEKDIHRIVETAAGFDYVVTTEKDLMRMRSTRLVEELGDKLVAQPMSVIADEDLDRIVLRYVDESRRKKSLPENRIKVQSAECKV